MPRTKKSSEPRHKGALTLGARHVRPELQPFVVLVKAGCVR